MLAEAQRKAKSRGVAVEWIQGDMRAFDLGGAFDFVFVTANSRLHLHEAEDLVSCFESVRRHLAPGARFVFDVFNPSVRRHGTTTLFAALEIATGKVTARTQPRHRHQEFLRFRRQVARAYPDRELHLVMDNYAAHKRVEIRDWLTANPRVHVHFTPTSASWMNLDEVWFGIIEKPAIHCGSFGSVKDLTIKIRVFINGWNDRCHPFVWTKPPTRS
jgi:SAM-dependent methyltransferase